MEKGIENMTEKELIDLMNSPAKTGNPGTVDLGLNDNVHRPEAKNEKPMDQWSIEDWSKAMGATDGRNNNSVNLNLR